MRTVFASKKNSNVTAAAAATIAATETAAPGATYRVSIDTKGFRPYRANGAYAQEKRLMNAHMRGLNGWNRSLDSIHQALWQVDQFCGIDTEVDDAKAEEYAAWSAGNLSEYKDRSGALRVVSPAPYSVERAADRTMAGLYEQLAGLQPGDSMSVGFPDTLGTGGSHFNGCFMRLERVS